MNRLYINGIIIVAKDSDAIEQLLLPLKKGLDIDLG